MSSKPTIFFAATLMSVCIFATSYAQSGSRGAAPAFRSAPSFSQAPSTSFAPPAQFAPAPAPIQAITSQSFAAPAPQPFASSGCPNCQLNSAVSRPVVNYAPQSYSYSQPSYTPSYSAPVQYSAPGYSSYAPTYSAPVYQTQQSYSPAPIYYQSYAPAVYSGGCGGY